MFEAFKNDEGLKIGHVSSDTKSWFFPHFESNLLFVKPLSIAPIFNCLVDVDEHAAREAMLEFVLAHEVGKR